MVFPILWLVSGFPVFVSYLSMKSYNPSSHAAISHDYRPRLTRINGIRIKSGVLSISTVFPPVPVLSHHTKIFDLSAIASIDKSSDILNQTNDQDDSSNRTSPNLRF